jgi:predicted outer membrane repeat protein
MFFFILKAFYLKAAPDNNNTVARILATKFVFNQAFENGGAIYIDEQWVVIESCVFLNNKAQKGGALYYNTSN